jgi:hypothetical protein
MSTVIDNNESTNFGACSQGVRSQAGSVRAPPGLEAPPMFDLAMPAP